MARITERKTEANRAAIYARVSDKSQDGEDKTSISEQTGEMEAYCESKGLTITARYQEVGRGWSKKRPEFQRMLADAKRGRFDTIVCWKSDRLSRGMYPAAALMEVVEAHQVRLEAVMDAIDMKTFGLMAAIGKIELDNFRERSTLGKRGTAKQGRVPTGGVPYGYRIGDDGRLDVVEEQAEVVRSIFDMYINEGMGSHSIAVRLTDEGIPTQTGKLLWLQSRVHHILGNTTYTGTWIYGKYRHVSTEDGKRVYDQPRDTWIEIPIPQVIDDETWERAQKLKKQRSRKAKRSTKVLYLLQHLLRCGECGHNFHAKSQWSSINVRNGKKYSYDLPTPRRYYKCNGMQSMRLRCREKPYIPAEKLEETIWSEVKRVIENPQLIVAGIDTLDSQEGGGLQADIAQAERDLRNIQMEEDRAVRLFVSGKITEAQLDLQRKFITERLESARAKLDDYRVQEASGAEKRRLMKYVLAWAKKVGKGVDKLTDEERKGILQTIVEEVVIDRNDYVRITLAIPVDYNSPEPESVAFASKVPSHCGSFWTFSQALVGIHPMDLVGPVGDAVIAELRDLATAGKVVAISEIGLDFMEGSPDRATQYQAFRAQISLAREVGLPVIFHSREAHAETLRVLREEGGYEVGGAAHYFQGDLEAARQVIDLGFYISLARPLLRLPHLQEAAAGVPLEHIVLETDAAPQPFKARRERWTEPRHVRDVAGKLAEPQPIFPRWNPVLS